MAHAVSTPVGVYLDDGTYTYLGRKTNWFKDQLVDNIIKKIVYGTWWKQPKTIGASDWIQDAYIAFPKFACSALQDKNIRQLPLNLNRNEFRELSLLSLQGLDTDTDISTLGGLLLLPHDSVVNHSSLLKFKEWCKNINGRIAYKHHPRTSNKTAFTSAIPSKSLELPSKVPMEVMLPLLPENCVIVGDISTALLTSKWLRPELSVSAIADDISEPEWIFLLKELQIEILD
ncbi:hypothetical protein GCM10007941_12320 [Amphritea balenae]|nr:hypothetical protein GCM10007941_12320 [Amphritea balenae]